jgi:hypothetical protein
VKEHYAELRAECDAQKEALATVERKLGDKEKELAVAENDVSAAKQHPELEKTLRRSTLRKKEI